jgi:hypothetical protein
LPLLLTSRLVDETSARKGPLKAPSREAEMTTPVTNEADTKEIPKSANAVHEFLMLWIKAILTIPKVSGTEPEEIVEGIFQEFPQATLLGGPSGD